MYRILDEDIRTLIRETTPWIIGSKGANENFVPIFKENIPLGIIEKHEMLIHLINMSELILLVFLTPTLATFSRSFA